jgi:hypothetical protein
MMKGKANAMGRGPFKYNNVLDNHVVWPGREEALHSFLRQPYGGMFHKVRNAHSSNSEDALTWSCFDTLRQVSPEARQQALTEIWPLAFSTSVPQEVLAGTINVGKRYGKDESTEVDASIEAPGALVFIEAKLYSPMSPAEPAKGKPHNQIERKLRVGLRQAADRGQFYFILLDIAPLTALQGLNAGASLADATTPKDSGFAAKWTTAYWFSRYKYGHRGSLAPLQTLLNSAGLSDLRAKDVAKRMGWLTWSDLFKSVLRATIAARGPLTA